LFHVEEDQSNTLLKEKLKKKKEGKNSTPIQIISYLVKFLMTKNSWKVLVKKGYKFSKPKN
jgi:hypothetical protein